MCCVVPGCYNRKNEQRPIGTGFHMFPKDPELNEKWRKAVSQLQSVEGWVPKPSSVVCTSHFADRDVDRSLPFGPRLRANSVPSIFPNVLVVNSSSRKTVRTVGMDRENDVSFGFTTIEVPVRLVFEPHDDSNSSKDAFNSEGDLTMVLEDDVGSSTNSAQLSKERCVILAQKLETTRYRTAEKLKSIRKLRILNSFLDSRLLAMKSLVTDLTSACRSDGRPFKMALPRDLARKVEHFIENDEL